MKSRIITGVVGSILLIAILLLPPIALHIALSAVCAVAMYELLVTTHFVKNRGVLAASIIFSACTPFFMFGESRFPAFMILLGYVFGLVCLQIKYHEDLPIEHTSFAFFSSMIFPISFSCIAYLRSFSVRDGLFYCVLAIVIPWMCDMGAYFVGTFFGKNKLCPKISPKKTVEGLVGGIVVSILCALLVSFLYQIMFLKEAATVSLWQIALLTLVCAPLSVLGDLFASLIKRQCHVKDYGNIIPGHGGVMDRFDSFVLCVPLIFIVVQYIPLIY